ncbi:hypothetical protein [Algicella marina]|uniref:Uncharacterized protein n=1 Tax=Algicella marina TaxID=2683284 RepID=A0A6P1T1A7_9RHOB|nr:hypothetical protein [Algicella marina]QHQ36694.1 hypothetical protein GO499_16695 [Algicella marina]
MRSLTVMVVVMLATVAHADIRTLAECRSAVSEDAAAVREEAARWITLGGGAEARLCEIAALEALGAQRVAATKLTELAQDRGTAISTEARAVMFADAGRMWLNQGQLVLARKTLEASAALAPEGAEHLAPLAELEMEEENWEAAEAALTRLLAVGPENNRYFLRAIARRQAGLLEGALEDLAEIPETEKVRLERALIWAAQGKAEAAQVLALSLASETDDHDIRAAARELLAARALVDAPAGLEAADRPVLRDESVDAAAPESGPSPMPRP